MSQLSQPIPIPTKDSPEKQHRQRSSASSREGSPSSSSGMQWRILEFGLAEDFI